MDPKIVIAGILSFTIASIGWALLYIRSNKMALRSETFSLISEAISILQEFESIAEEQLKDVIEQTVEVNLDSASYENKQIRKVQLIEGKFLVKFKLFRQRLNYLEKRNIVVGSEDLIKIKQAMTSGVIDTSMKYQSVLSSTHDVHQILYNRFEERYNPLTWLDYMFSPTQELKLMAYSCIFLLLPCTPAIIVLFLQFNLN